MAASFQCDEPFLWILKEVGRTVVQSASFCDTSFLLPRGAAACSGYYGAKIQGVGAEPSNTLAANGPAKPRLPAGGCALADPHANPLDVPFFVPSLVLSIAPPR